MGNLVFFRKSDKLIDGHSQRSNGRGMEEIKMKTRGYKRNCVKFRDMKGIFSKS